MTEVPASLETAFRDNERLLWGLCYRMTGCAADADDLLQDTFQRAIERPPPDTDRAWRPWLVRIAVNLSRDQLRHRRRRGYTGPWLPSPVEPPAFEIEDGAMSTAGRYDLMESVSFAFLLALEELTPQKRAVLVLRDVFDYSVKETAEALDMTETAVKTTLHRARRQLSAYDHARKPASEVSGPALAALTQLMTALTLGDTEAMAKVLSEDVRALSDGGGEFHAALNPIVGIDRVIRFFQGLMRLRGLPTSVIARTFNGLPALVASFEHSRKGEAPVTVVRVELASDGRIAEVHSILATRKLTAIAVSRPSTAAVKVPRMPQW